MDAREPEARAALRWIDAYADLQGNGYISYQRRNEETGLENQCWKDSWDSISTPRECAGSGGGPRRSLSSWVGVTHRADHRPCVPVASIYACARMSRGRPAAYAAVTGPAGRPGGALPDRRDSR